MTWQRSRPAAAVGLLLLALVQRGDVPALAAHARLVQPRAAVCAPWIAVPGPADGLVALAAAGADDVWAAGTTRQAGVGRGTLAHWNGRQ